MSQNTKDCPICYESYDISNMINCPNNHIASCIECLSRITNNTCPICRNSLGDSITTTTTTTTTRTSSRLDMILRREEVRREREERERVEREREERNRFYQQRWDERERVEEERRRRREERERVEEERRNRREERERERRELLEIREGLVSILERNQSLSNNTTPSPQPQSNNTTPRPQEDQTYDNNIQNIIRNHRSDAQRARRDRERANKSYSQQSRRTQLRWSKKFVERSRDVVLASSIRDDDLFNHRSMGQRLRRQRDRAI